MNNFRPDDTIVAISTPSGSGAIGVIRLSGEKACQIVSSFFSKGDLSNHPSHTVHFGVIREPDGALLDEVVASWFKGPNSYTGEDVIELSCHGSFYILEKVLELCLSHGARLAEAGEFTQRAFLNQKLDLSQAEAVADLIASESQAQHEIAMKQMRGGYSSEIGELREQLINFAALIELELDFSEEEVEFADRNEFLGLIDNIQSLLRPLIDSFAYGNVIKDGIPVAIVGKPNAGKSSLLNALLNEERAIVSEIPGTTRDTVEDTLNIEGVKFRFIDTAGIRNTDDRIEAIGVQKAKEKAAQSKMLIYLYDRKDTTHDEIIDAVKELHQEGLIVLLVENKIDLLNIGQNDDYLDHLELELSTEVDEYLAISAHDPASIETVKKLLIKQVKGLKNDSSHVVTNIRHRDALQSSLTGLKQVREGLLQGISGDLLALDIRECLRHLGEITGAVDVDRDILGTIFGRFCIGK